MPSYNIYFGYVGRWFMLSENESFFDDIYDEISVNEVEYESIMNEKDFMISSDDDVFADWCASVYEDLSM